MIQRLLQDRRGEGSVDYLLVATVALVAAVVAAYVWMPDFQRGARAIVREAAALVGF